MIPTDALVIPSEPLLNSNGFSSTMANEFHYSLQYWNAMQATAGRSDVMPEKFKEVAVKTLQNSSEQEKAMQAIGFRWEPMHCSNRVASEGSVIGKSREYYHEQPRISRIEEVPVPSLTARIIAYATKFGWEVKSHTIWHLVALLFWIPWRSIWHLNRRVCWLLFSNDKNLEASTLAAIGTAIGWPLSEGSSWSSFHCINHSSWNFPAPVTPDMLID